MLSSRHLFMTFIAANSPIKKVKWRDSFGKKDAVQFKVLGAFAKSAVWRQVHFFDSLNLFGHE